MSDLTAPFEVGDEVLVTTDRPQYWPDGARTPIEHGPHAIEKLTAGPLVVQHLEGRYAVVQPVDADPNAVGYHVRYEHLRLAAGGVTQATKDLAVELEAWWLGIAADEIEAVVPKAVEYSATDLADIGRVLAHTAGREVDDEEATELGIYFYLVGKLGRWTGAVKEGRRPSDDTLHDIGVYVRMAQRTRAVGGWPTGTKESGGE